MLNLQKGKVCPHYDKNGFAKFPYTHSVDRHLTETFKNIKSRCYDENNKDYRWYGGKGVKVCDEWLYNPISFSNWSIENGYKKGLTIDRIDPNGNYEPCNCRWIEREENSRRAGKVNWITVDGKTLTGRQWSQMVGKSVNYINIYLLKNGMDMTISHIRELLWRLAQK